MGTGMIVRQMLRSLCENTQWNYAVLWKLDHWNQTELKLEDGYFGNLVPDNAVGTLHNDHCNVDLSFASLLPDSDAKYEHLMGHLVVLADENMRLPYSSGEGLVCKAAFSKKHQWVHASDHQKLFTKYSDEWKLQFAAGIKTILLVPVLTDGVLQLGSFNKVMEDPEIVHSIKELFNTLQQDDGTCYSLTRLSGLLPLSKTIPSVEGLSESIFCNGMPIPVQLQQLAVRCPTTMDFYEVAKNNLDPSQPFSIFQNDHPISHSFELQEFGNDYRSHGDERIENFLYKDVAISDNVMDYSCVNDESDLTSQTSDSGYTTNPTRPSAVMPFEKDNKIPISNTHIETENCTYEDVTFMNVNYMEKDSSLKFPVNSELHKVLGMCLPEESADLAWASSPPRASGLNKSRASHETKDIGEQLSFTEPIAFLKNDKETEDLLETIITSLHHDSGANASKMSPHKNACSTLSGQLQDSSMTENKTKGDLFVECNLGQQAYDGFRFFSTNDCPTNLSSQNSFKNISMLTTTLSTKEATCSHYTRHSNISTKQRCRNNVHKPRPRDRQLIQDRIKELRELVPDGSKCSIDGLLDRTVKHMLFLQGVSTRADKLRKCTQPEVKGRSLNPHKASSHQNGTSWVFQPGSQTETCPLVVEDLDQHGQMLVEMLCNDYAMFIEMVQVIRHLKLTILKGVLESRSENLWAHFIVEVSRGFHRVDILWPLMQLLQSNHCRIPNNM